MSAHRSLTGDPYSADIILAAGRGLKDALCFSRLLQLADRLDAQVVGTRGALDMGWIPHEREVGLSGLRIAPKLYIAFGVSGANFHTIGMHTSEYIIAVNTDEKARIFHLADLCVYADAESVIDNLLDETVGSSMEQMSAEQGRPQPGESKIIALAAQREQLLRCLIKFPHRVNTVRKND